MAADILQKIKTDSCWLTQDNFIMAENKLCVYVLCVLTDLSVISFHISPAFLVSSVIEIPGNFSFRCDLFSFIQMKYAD